MPRLESCFILPDLPVRNEFRASVHATDHLLFGSAENPSAREQCGSLRTMNMLLEVLRIRMLRPQHLRKALKSLSSPILDRSFVKIALENMPTGFNQMVNSLFR
jgi:hypothetical protein